VDGLKSLLFLMRVTLMRLHYPNDRLRNDVLNPTRLQLEEPGHAQFRAPPFHESVQKVNPMERRKRAKEAADFVFKDETNCARYLEGGRGTIELSAESIRKLGLDAKEVYGHYVKQCSNSDAPAALPRQIASLKDGAEKIRIILHAHELCMLYRKNELATLKTRARQHMLEFERRYVESIRRDIEANIDKAMEDFTSEIDSGGAGIANALLEHARDPLSRHRRRPGE